MKKLRQINKGIISFRLALIQIAYMTVIFIVDISGNSRLYFTNTYGLWETIIRIVISIIGLSLGVVSLFQKESNKVRTIIGIIISAPVLIGPVVTIFKIIILSVNIK